MNRYLETELEHGTAEWDVLKESFLLNFSFEDGFECIDEALRMIKVVIFKMPEELVVWVQPDWSTQLRHALEYYNVTTKEGEEDPINTNILKSEGQCKVEGPKAEIPHISEPLKTKQVNIGSEAQLKFAKIGYYWDEDTIDKVTELLREYQELFPTKFSDLKGIVGYLGVMKITLKLDVKQVKQFPYQLNPKYKEKVCKELDKMLEPRIIEPMAELDWVSPMVVQEKKQQDEIRICRLEEVE